MSWVKLDDGFADNPKVAALDDRAFRTFVWMLCYCAGQLTDGYVDKAATRRCPAGARKDRLERTLCRLVDAGLIEVEGDGYRVSRYLEYNPSKAQVEEKRKQGLERWRRWQEKQDEPPNGVSNAVRATPTNATPVPSPPVKPSPRPAVARPQRRPGPAERTCDKCGEQREVAEWPDGRWLCGECGGAEALSRMNPEAIGKAF